MYTNWCSISVHPLCILGNGDVSEFYTGKIVNPNEKLNAETKNGNLDHVGAEEKVTQVKGELKDPLPFVKVPILCMDELHWKCIDFIDTGWKRAQTFFTAEDGILTFHSLSLEVHLCLLARQSTVLQPQFMQVQNIRLDSR